VDYNLPERFDISYVGSDNKPHQPVMIHRAPFGSMERFCGLLIEHFAGDFPTWLAPEQIRILTLNDENIPYAKEVLKFIHQAGIRASIDETSEKCGAKIRRAKLEKIRHMFVIGSQEQMDKKISLRSRKDKSFEGNHTSMPLSL
jgi:threonyl-tRNA synthetase